MELTNRIKSFVKPWFDDLQCGQVTLGNPIFASRFTTNEMCSRPVTIAVDCNPGHTEKVKTQQGHSIYANGMNGHNDLMLHVFTCSDTIYGVFMFLHALFFCHICLLAIVAGM